MKGDPGPPGTPGSPGERVSLKTCFLVIYRMDHLNHSAHFQKNISIDITFLYFICYFVLLLILLFVFLFFIFL